MTDAEQTPEKGRAAERALAWVREGLWAIQPEALETIVAIASREHEVDVEALAAKSGNPLQGTDRVEVRENGVALVTLRGPIFRYANMFTRISGATSLDVVARDFQAALADPRVRSIVLNVDSPGGEVSGVHEFARMVRDARGTKPVVAYVGSKAASAAYFIAAAADKIVMDAMAIAGSIGVIATVSTDKGKNIVEIVSSQSPNKRPDVTTDAGRTELQKHVDRLAQVFVDSVAEFRGVSAKTVMEEFGRGGVLVGSDAVEAGMADELGSLEALIAGISGNQKGAHMSNGNQMPEITREFIADKHPAIAEAFREEGRKAGHDDGVKQGREQGAVAERERIQAVEAQSMPGHEDLIATLKFDGKTSGNEAAAQVLAAVKAKNGTALENIRKDASTARVAPGGDPAATDTTKKVDAGIRVPAGFAVDTAAAELHQKALAYQAANPGIDYLAAVRAVQAK